MSARHLAALDFLLNIPMKHESIIIETGGCRKIATAPVEVVEENNFPHDENILEYNDYLDENDSPSAGSFLQKEEGGCKSPGRRLEGRIAPTARLPLAFRYRTHRFSEQSAIVRQVKGLALQCFLL